MRACQVEGSSCIRRLVWRYSRDAPPSIRYEATVKGAPAKPISGTRSDSALRTFWIASKTKGVASRGSTSARPARSAAPRTGRWMTGPSPLANSRPTPMASTGRRMSAKMIAASTPRRSTGRSVTSAAASGFLQSSRKPNRARSARYSAMKRPAWRISQTGVYSAGSRRHARRKGADVAGFMDHPAYRPLPAESRKREDLTQREAYLAAIVVGLPSSPTKTTRIFTGASPLLNAWWPWVTSLTDACLGVLDGHLACRQPRFEDRCALDPLRQRLIVRRRLRKPRRARLLRAGDTNHEQNTQTGEKEMLHSEALLVRSAAGD